MSREIESIDEDINQVCVQLFFVTVISRFGSNDQVVFRSTVYRHNCLVLLVVV